MAEFTATVAERVNVFGVQPSTKWNDFVWNTGKWGDGAVSSLPVGVAAGVQEAQASSDTAGLTAFVTVSESEATAESLPDIYVRDEAGYFYIFPDRTTDGEERDSPTWTSGAVTSVSWAAVAVSAASWS